MGEYRPDEGSYDFGEARIAVAVARWNGEITEGLLGGAQRTLARHGFDNSNFEVFRVPGAFELPLAVQRILCTGRFDAVLALGCVIRGDTPHFDYVCSETARGLGQVALAQDKVVAFGLLTTDTLEQAQLRSADNKENKGEEAALTALEMLSLFRHFD